MLLVTANNNFYGLPLNGSKPKGFKTIRSKAYARNKARQTIDTKPQTSAFFHCCNTLCNSSTAHVAIGDENVRTIGVHCTSTGKSISPLLNM